PRVRFTEDPVRMLRAVRFAAMLGFTVEAETWDAMLGQSNAIALAAPPRLYEEVLKLFLLGEGEKSYQLLRRTGLFTALFPFFSDWLDRESEGFPHTRVGEALDRIDSRIRSGEKVSPQLLLALVFGQYLEEKGARLRAEGAQPQQAIDQAVAGLLEEQAPTVLIPNRVGLQVRMIVGNQSRFRKMPGRHPLSFIKRPGFREALDYLCITGDIAGENGEVCSWWEKFVRDNPLSPAAEPVVEEMQKPAVGRRRRRRRGKKGGIGAPVSD
ncbi:MAG TPA: poly(A) polymerase, partial [Geobacteraceae bacterium]|nr:poly(A) polymerase [Geobacteraceae bacterium]